jgi:hypothetical protein
MRIWIRLILLLSLLNSSVGLAQLQPPSTCSRTFGGLLVDPVITEALKQNEKHFLQSFQATSGFGSFEAFRNLLTQSQHPLVLQFQNVIAKRDYEVVMARPYETRNKLLQEARFRGLHESSRTLMVGSDGSTQKVIQNRINLYASYLGLSPQAYAATANWSKPKFALIRRLPPNADQDILKTPIERYANTERKGDRRGDVYIFDFEKVRARSTYTLGDSLNRVQAISEAFNNGYQSFSRNLWDRHLIPLDYLEAIIPEALPLFKSTGQIAVRPVAPKEAYMGWFGDSGFDFLKTYRRGDEASFYNKGQGPMFENGDPYIEIQIFGDTDLSVIKAFEFWEEPPSGEFLKLLDAYRIEIRDARGEVPKLWVR